MSGEKVQQLRSPNKIQKVGTFLSLVLRKAIGIGPSWLLGTSPRLKWEQEPISEVSLTL